MQMTKRVTHFEIYGDHPVALADFHRQAFGWQVERMPGLGYWRVGGNQQPNTALNPPDDKG